tara:strand:+ start:439 stop:570 length:132 start_codon:yes stop_codon:yes gene_type:complete
MEVTPVEVLREIERQFPKELMICVQAVQIRKLTEEENDTDDEQ